MPMINIKFDDTRVSDEEVTTLSYALQKIVSEVTAIEDVFVYADSPRIKIRVAPIEAFVNISDHKVPDLEKMSETLRNKLSEWKQDNGFKYPINLTVIPMKWKFEIGI